MTFQGKSIHTSASGLPVLCSVMFAPVLIDKLCRGEHLDLFIARYIQKVLVPADHDLTPAGNGCGKKLVVILVHAHWLGKRVVCHKHSPSDHKADDRFWIHTR